MKKSILLYVCLLAVVDGAGLDAASSYKVVNKPLEAKGHAIVSAKRSRSLGGGMKVAPASTRNTAPMNLDAVKKENASNSTWTKITANDLGATWIAETTKEHVASITAVVPVSCGATSLSNLSSEPAIFQSVNDTETSRVTPINLNNDVSSPTNVANCSLTTDLAAFAGVFVPYEMFYASKLTGITKSNDYKSGKTTQDTKPGYPAPVPEPSSVLALLGGLAGFGSIALRKRS